MDKKFEEDNELKKLLEEQSIREAEIMEEALFSDEDFEDYEMTDEEVEASYKKLMERVNAGEVDESTPAGDEEKIISMTEKKNIHTSKRLAAMRAAGIAVACVAGVFLVSMTSEGNRQYVVDSVRYLLGEDTRIVVDNDEDNELPETDEYEAIADIEDTLGVDVPEFMYRPESFKYRSYNVDPKSGNAWIEYKYNEDLIVLDIDKENEDNSSVIYGIHGDEEVVNIDAENIEAIIIKIQDKNDIAPSYSARWERENIIYQFSGRMEKEIFCEMVRKVIY